MRATAVLSAVLLATTCACGSSDDTDPASPDAATVCQEQVADRLRSPSTAKFVGTPLTQPHASLEKVVIVTGEVDSENGFGAQVRSVYECSILREDDGTYRLSTGIEPKITTR